MLNFVNSDIWTIKAGCSLFSIFQSTVSGSSVGISAELKVVSSGSLIDFDADPGPHTVRATDQSTHQTTALPAEGGGWASFDDSSSLKLTRVTSMGIPAESFLSQLSVPQIAATANPSHSVVAGTISLSNQSNPMQWSTSHQNHPSLFEVPNVRSKPPFSTSISGASENPVSFGWIYNPSRSLANWLWFVNFLLQVLPIVRGLASVTGQSSQVVNTPNHQSTTGISQQPTNAVARPVTRKELPLVFIWLQRISMAHILEVVELHEINAHLQDLFAMTYSSSLGPFPYYQTPQPYMGYGMQVQYPSSIVCPISYNFLEGIISLVGQFFSYWHALIFLCCRPCQLILFLRHLQTPLLLLKSLD